MGRDQQHAACIKQHPFEAEELGAHRLAETLQPTSATNAQGEYRKGMLRMYPMRHQATQQDATNKTQNGYGILSYVYMCSLSVSLLALLTTNAVSDKDIRTLHPKDYSAAREHLTDFFA